MQRIIVIDGGDQAPKTLQAVTLHNFNCKGGQIVIPRALVSFNIDESREGAYGLTGPFADFKLNVQAVSTNNELYQAYDPRQDISKVSAARLIAELERHGNVQKQERYIINDAGETFKG
jgi:hypothetical protein